MKVVRPLWYLSRILGQFLTHPKKDLKLRHQKKVFASIIGCAKGYKSGDNMGAACKRMCGFFNFNANSPVVEGYR